MKYFAKCTSSYIFVMLNFILMITKEYFYNIIIICVFTILYKMNQSDIFVCSNDSNCGGAWYGKRRDWIG